MSSPTADDRRPARLPPRLVASARGRRLSAILHADLADYVRLMEDAEDRTISRLKSVRAEVWRPAIEAAGGRIVNIVADSVLAEFSSAVAAVSAAVDIQERMARFNDPLVEDQHLMFRIGLHLGDVIVDEVETIFGDAVNVAARIQLMAEPGGIAVSRALRDATHLLVDCAFVDGGSHHAKNVRNSLRIYHVHSRESASRLPVRTARRMRAAGITIRGPMLWGTIAAAALLLSGSGYLAFSPPLATSVSTAALSLSAEQLEQALAERRNADALAAEKRRLEEQARGSAEAETEARRQAGLELETARQARLKAEHELARLKADIEARRKAKDGNGDQATATAQRATEEAAQRKAEAEAAALRQTEEEAAKKVAATMSTRDEDAESLERRLRLQPADRQRLQVALTSLGFDTRGDDGVFGPRSREMIGRWQKARDQAPTGFVTRAQQQALLREAAVALSKYDEQRKAQEDVRTTAEGSAAPPASLPESPDGPWRGTYECDRTRNVYPFTLKPEMHLKGGTGTWYGVSPSWTNGQTVGISVSIEDTKVRVTHLRAGGSINSTTVLGRLDGNSIRASDSGCTMVLMREVPSTERSVLPFHETETATPTGPSTAPIASQPTSSAYGGMYSGTASAALPSPDGSWRGTYRCNANLQTGSPFVIDLKLHLTNGSATWRSAGPGMINGNSFDVGVSVVRDIASVARTLIRNGGLSSQAKLTGRYDGATISATGRENSSGRDCTLALTRA